VVMRAAPPRLDFIVLVSRRFAKRRFSRTTLMEEILSCATKKNRRQEF